MSDLISRQAAISAICNACGKIDCDKMDKCEKLQLPPANNSEIPNSSDTISRQAVLDALNNIEIPRNASWYQYYQQALTAVGKLPPAQPTPDQNGDLWITVPDIDEVTCVYVQENKSKFCRIFYEEQEQSERIIHCKDCKHWIPYDWMFSEVWQSKNMADYPEDEIGCNWCDMAMKAVDFCSRAERREVTT